MSLITEAARDELLGAFDHFVRAGVGRYPGGYENRVPGVDEVQDPADWDGIAKHTPLPAARAMLAARRKAAADALDDVDTGDRATNKAVRGLAKEIRREGGKLPRAAFAEMARRAAELRAEAEQVEARKRDGSALRTLADNLEAAASKASGQAKRAEHHARETWLAGDAQRRRTQAVTKAKEYATAVADMPAAPLPPATAGPLAAPRSPTAPSERDPAVATREAVDTMRAATAEAARREELDRLGLPHDASAADIADRRRQILVERWVPDKNGNYRPLPYPDADPDTDPDGYAKAMETRMETLRVNVNRSELRELSRLGQRNPELASLVYAATKHQRDTSAALTRLSQGWPETSQAWLAKAAEDLYWSDPKMRGGSPRVVAQRLFDRVTLGNAQSAKERQAVLDTGRPILTPEAAERLIAEGATDVLADAEAEGRYPARVRTEVDRRRRAGQTQPGQRPTSAAPSHAPAGDYGALKGQWRQERQNQPTLARGSQEETDTFHAWLRARGRADAIPGAAATSAPPPVPPAVPAAAPPSHVTELDRASAAGRVSGVDTLAVRTNPDTIRAANMDHAAQLFLYERVRASSGKGTHEALLEYLLKSGQFAFLHPDDAAAIVNERKPLWEVMLQARARDRAGARNLPPAYTRAAAVPRPDQLVHYHDVYSAELAARPGLTRSAYDAELAAAGRWQDMHPDVLASLASDSH